MLRGNDSRPRHAASAGRCCASSPAKKTCPTNRPTRRSPTRSSPARRRSGSWAPSRAASTSPGMRFAFVSLSPRLCGGEGWGEGELGSRSRRWASPPHPNPLPRSGGEGVRMSHPTQAVCLAVVRRIHHRTAWKVRSSHPANRLVGCESMCSTRQSRSDSGSRLAIREGSRTIGSGRVTEVVEQPTQGPSSLCPCWFLEPRSARLHEAAANREQSNRQQVIAWEVSAHRTLEDND